MNRKSSISLVFLLFFSFFSLYVKAEKTPEKLISKVEKFPARDISLLKIQSKYGKIKIENWERDEIELASYIRVSSDTKETAQNILSNVFIKRIKNAHSLDINTEFGTFFSFMKFTNNLFRNGEFSIDFVVKAPKNIAADIRMQNGDIVLFERSGAVAIEHSRGSVSIEKIKGKSRLKLRSSRVKIIKADSVSLDCRNSTVFLEKCSAVVTTSYNSKYKIGKVGSLKAHSMRDDFQIQKIAAFFAESSLSNFVIDQFADFASVETNYGNLKIEKIEKGFQEIKVNSKGTKLYLGLNSISANVLINHHLSTKMHIPERLGLSMKFDERPKYFITKGVIGRNKKGHKIQLRTKGGSLLLW